MNQLYEVSIYTRLVSVHFNFQFIKYNYIHLETAKHSTALPVAF